VYTTGTVEDIMLIQHIKQHEGYIQTKLITDNRIYKHKDIEI